MKTITFEEFLKTHKPIQNPLTKEGSYGNMSFETYGKDLEYVTCSLFADKQIWTLISSDNEESWIVPGYHIVNRECYFICEIPWENEDIQVNDNEMLTNKEAVDACVNFFSTLNFKLDRYEVQSFFGEEKEFTLGGAKYLAIDYWEDLGNELTSEQQDLIHNFYSNLV